MTEQVCFGWMCAAGMRRSPPAPRGVTENRRHQEGAGNVRLGPCLPSKPLCPGPGPTQSEAGRGAGKALPAGDTARHGGPGPELRVQGQSERERSQATILQGNLPARIRWVSESADGNQDPEGRQSLGGVGTGKDELQIPLRPSSCFSWETRPRVSLGQRERGEVLGSSLVTGAS